MRRVLRAGAYLVAMALLVLYLLNPGAGVFEVLPDNLPGWGNLDEAAAMALLVHFWKRLRLLRRGANEASARAGGR